jgi:hypothetical protein
MPAKRAGAVLRAGLTDVLVTGNADEVNERQREPDRDAGKSPVRDGA